MHRRGSLGLSQTKGRCSMPRQALRYTLAERFWQKVAKTQDGCWVWTANCIKDRHGRKRYGLLGAGRRGEGMLYAHRVAWELHHGLVPEGLLVLHRCDNPQCVRPDHLFLGTQYDNMQDMIHKGRRGVTGPSPGAGAKSKLSRRQVLEMRRHGAMGVSRAQLAAQYGVSVGTVRNILLRFTNQNR